MSATFIRSPDGSVYVEGECPECDGGLDVDGTDVVCAECGLVLDADALDAGPEWRDFPEDAPGESTGAMKRCNGPPRTPTYYDKSMGSELGVSEWKATPKLRRMKRQHGRRDRQDRNLRDALVEVARLSSCLDVPEAVRERAAVLFREAHEEGLVVGRSIDATAAAVVWTACRELDVPVTFDDVTEASGEDASLIRTTFEVVTDALECYRLGPTVSELVPRVASDVGLSKSARRKARELAQVAEDAHLDNGRSRAGVAAACVYRAGVLDAATPVTQERVADVAGVSAVTLRHRRDDLLAEVDDAE